MIRYYRERKNGDYLCIDTSTNEYYLTTQGKDYFEGRATAIAGMVSSVCTTGISREFLRKECQRVGKKEVPAAWLLAFFGSDSQQNKKGKKRVSQAK
jgi:hypothetical protein